MQQSCHLVVWALDMVIIGIFGCLWVFEIREMGTQLSLSLGVSHFVF